MSGLQPKVAIGDEFLTAFAAIPRRKQRAVMNFVTRFRENPRGTGINYENIHSARDKNFRSVRIDQDYRGIVLSPEKGDVYVLLWVDKHDDAYKWAGRHRCEINPKTGTLQLYETTVEVEESPPAAAPEDALAASEPPAVATETEPATPIEAPLPDPLFVAVSEQQLLSIGVPEPRLLLVQNLRTVEALEAAEPKLPIEAFEALYLLAAGTPLQSILDDYAAPDTSTVDTEDFGAALERPQTQRRFCVPEDEQELGRMLNAPLERWRVFLHPQQRQLVERDWNGPVRVLGGAGTGKTVVAMHRARWLASQLAQGDNKQILFTTFTSNLAVDINENLKKICTPEQLKRIEVCHFDAWVNRFVSQHDYALRIVYSGGYGDVYDSCWKLAESLIPHELGLHPEFFKEEWERVILDQQVQTLREYFKANRVGRGVALNRKQRKDIWPVFEEMRAQLARNNAATAEDAMVYAIDIIQQGIAKPQYQHIVVDEAQDFSHSAWQLVRVLAGEEGKNDIFLVGDAHQRIYRRRASLKQSGINIIGRGRKLRINYRTTELIRRFATALLTNQPIDDLDGGEDTSTEYRSLVVGEKPLIKHFTNGGEEKTWLFSEIENIHDELLAHEPGASYADICVVARTNRLGKNYAEFLESQGVPTHTLSRQKADDRSKEGVRIATMHRIKGLEFKAVFVVAVNDKVVPLRFAISNTKDPIERRLNELTERALFHVAATRAVRFLRVSSYGERSLFLRTAK